MRKAKMGFFPTFTHIRPIDAPCKHVDFNMGNIDKTSRFCQRYMNLKSAEDLCD